MKSSLLLAGLLSTIALHAEPTPPKTAGAEGGVMETKSYELNRYSRLMNKSPFDFDVPPPPPAATIPAMADWALAGLTKATDYSVVNLVNLKTQERLRLTRYVAPPSKKANETKSGSDIYTLESIEFDEGKPMTVKNAVAMVTKNGEQGSVSFDPKVLQMKPAAGKNPMQAMMPGTQPNGQPMPNGQTPLQGAPNANGNQALMQMLQQRNATQGQPQNTNQQPAVNLPGQAPQVPQPNIQPQPATVQPQAQAIPPQTQPQVFSNTGPAPTQPNAANGAQPRRRVVLPSNEPTPPPGQ